MVRTAMGTDIVGRQEELAEVDDFLAAARAEPRALVIAGEAGIGKTRIWKEGLGRSQADGARILVSRPGGADVTLAFAGLADLLRDVDGETLGELPPPQRRALAVALMLESGQPPDELTVAAAFLGIVRRLAAATPVLLAVDDIQWLDAASMGVLEFTLRRLEVEPVGALLAARVQQGETAPSTLLRAVGEERLHWLHLEPLRVGSLFELIRSRLGLRLGRRTLLRVHETSGGNPLYALELARALADLGSEPAAGEPLPVPPTLQELVTARLSALSEGTQETLRVAAALRKPSLRLLAEAVGDPELVDTELGEAIAAGIVEVVDGEIRFAHPLLASIHYSNTSVIELQRLHTRLAESVATREERARHLALAARAPDSSVAAALESASAEARSRGAIGAAAELLEQAVALTPEAERTDRFRRRVAAAEIEFSAGNVERSRLLLDAALGEATRGRERAEVLHLLGEMMLGDDIGRSVELLREAEREAAGHDALRAQILCSLGKFRYGHWIGYDVSEECARTAAELAERSGDRRALSLALALLAQRIFQRGGGLEEELLERAVRIEHEQNDTIEIGEDASATIICAELLLECERPDAARPLLEHLCDTGRRIEDAGVAYPLHALAYLEFLAGRWSRAETVATESLEIASQSGRETIEVVAASVVGMVEGGLGRVSSARRLLTKALELAQRTGRGGRAPRYGLGLLELSVEDHAAAWSWLEPAIARILPLGLTEPTEHVADGVEALAELGRADEASELLSALEEPARRLGRNWALAAAARGRGLVLASNGELEAAEQALQEAVTIGELVPRPLELGRSLLALGTVQRRLRHKQLARVTLGRAVGVFEHLEAPIWAERARRESARIGGRVSSNRELSATELKIAELVCSGQSNKEIAGALHVSVKTVEWNLSKIYRKLGVRSRTELGAAFRKDL
jgi:DNA-binding CsgD family transcriptional regulator